MRFIMIGAITIIREKIVVEFASSNQQSCYPEWRNLMPRELTMNYPYAHGSSGTRYENLIQAYYACAFMTDHRYPGCEDIVKESKYIQFQAQPHFKTDNMVVVFDRLDGQEVKLIVHIKGELEGRAAGKLYLDALQNAWEHFVAEGCNIHKDKVVLIVKQMTNTPAKKFISIFSLVKRCRSFAELEFKLVAKEKNEYMDSIIAILEAIHGQRRVADEIMFAFLKNIYFVQFDEMTASSQDLQQLLNKLAPYMPKRQSITGENFWALLVDKVAEWSVLGSKIYRHDIPVQLRLALAQSQEELFAQYLNKSDELYHIICSSKLSNWSYLADKEYGFINLISNYIAIRFDKKRVEQLQRKEHYTNVLDDSPYAFLGVVQDTIVPLRTFSLTVLQYGVPCKIFKYFIRDGREIVPQPSLATTPWVTEEACKLAEIFSYHVDPSWQLATDYQVGDQKRYFDVQLHSVFMMDILKDIIERHDLKAFEEFLGVAESISNTSWLGYLYKLETIGTYDVASHEQSILNSIDINEGNIVNLCTSKLFYEALDLLLERYGKSCDFDRHDGYRKTEHTPLTRLISIGDFKRARKMVECGANPNIRANYSEQSRERNRLPLYILLDNLRKDDLQSQLSSVGFPVVDPSEEAIQLFEQLILRHKQDGFLPNFDENITCEEYIESKREKYGDGITDRLIKVIQSLDYPYEAPEREVIFSEAEVGSAPHEGNSTVDAPVEDEPLPIFTAAQMFVKAEAAPRNKVRVLDAIKATAVPPSKKRRIQEQTDVESDNAAEMQRETALAQQYATFDGRLHGSAFKIFRLQQSYPSSPIDDVMSEFARGSSDFSQRK